MRRLRPIFLAFGGVIASAAAGLAVVLHAEREAVISLVVAQISFVLWMGVRSWDAEHQWTRPEVILAAAWALTFTLPSCIYAIEPHLMDVVDHPVGPLAVINLSLLCLLLGIHVVRTRWPPQSRSRYGLTVASTTIRTPVVVCWTVLGLIGLALVFRGAGGPVEYASNLDDEGRLTQGRIYFVWMALAVRYAAQIVLFSYWTSQRRAPRWAIGYFVASLALTGLLGARLFVAAAIVEVALFYVLVRRPVSLRLAVPLTILAAFSLIAVGGAVKRYSNYQSANPDSEISLAMYLRSEAPGEIASAYANNYADGVRLISLALVTVPEHAAFERGKLLLRYVTQPIPRSFRPEIARDPALARALYPGGGYAHAMPLQASAYIQGGIPTVATVFLGLGLLVAWLDKQIMELRRTTLTKLVLLTAAAVALPSYIRASDAGALAVASMDVLGLGVVAWTAQARLHSADHFFTRRLQRD